MIIVASPFRPVRDESMGKSDRNAAKSGEDGSSDFLRPILRWLAMPRNQITVARTWRGSGVERGSARYEDGLFATWPHGVRTEWHARCDDCTVAYVDPDSVVGVALGDTYPDVELVRAGGNEQAWPLAKELMDGADWLVLDTGGPEAGFEVTVSPQVTADPLDLGRGVVAWPRSAGRLDLTTVTTSPGPKVTRSSRGTESVSLPLLFDRARRRLVGPTLVNDVSFRGQRSLTYYDAPCLVRGGDLIERALLCHERAQTAIRARCHVRRVFRSPELRVRLDSDCLSVGESAPDDPAVQRIADRLGTWVCHEVPRLVRSLSLVCWPGWLLDAALEGAHLLVGQPGPISTRDDAPRLRVLEGGSELLSRECRMEVGCVCILPLPADMRHLGSLLAAYISAPAAAPLVVVHIMGPGEVMRCVGATYAAMATRFAEMDFVGMDEVDLVSATRDRAAVDGSPAERTDRVAMLYVKSAAWYAGRAPIVHAEFTPDQVKGYWRKDGVYVRGRSPSE